MVTTIGPKAFQNNNKYCNTIIMNKPLKQIGSQQEYVSTSKLVLIEAREKNSFLFSEHNRSSCQLNVGNANTSMCGILTSDTKVNGMQHICDAKYASRLTKGQSNKFPGQCHGQPRQSLSTGWFLSGWDQIALCCLCWQVWLKSFIQKESLLWKKFKTFVKKRQTEDVLHNS